MTLVAGYYKKKVLDDRVFIYPAASWLFNLEINDWLYNGIKEYMDKDVDHKVIDYGFENKTFIIAPYNFSVSEYMYGSDCIILTSKLNLEKYYQNYVTTGNWYRKKEITMPDDVKKMLEE